MAEAYQCPTCGTSDRNRFYFCNLAACPGGRDQSGNMALMKQLLSKLDAPEPQPEFFFEPVDMPLGRFVWPNPVDVYKPIAEEIRAKQDAANALTSARSAIRHRVAMAIDPRIENAEEAAERLAMLRSAAQRRIIRTVRRDFPPSPSFWPAMGLFAGAAGVLCAAMILLALTGVLFHAKTPTGPKTVQTITVRKPVEAIAEPVKEPEPPPVIQAAPEPVPMPRPAPRRRARP